MVEAANIPSFAKFLMDNMKSFYNCCIYVYLAAERYGIMTVGYGPGSVNTNIRRELPKFLMALVQPLFYFSTRQPEDVAKQFIAILSDTTMQSGNAYHYDKNGGFHADGFIANTTRQNQLLSTSS
jgi:hypothetical protein